MVKRTLKWVAASLLFAASALAQVDDNAQTVSGYDLWHDGNTPAKTWNGFVEVSKIVVHTNSQPQDLGPKGYFQAVGMGTALNGPYRFSYTTNNFNAFTNDFGSFLQLDDNLTPGIFDWTIYSSSGADKFVSTNKFTAVAVYPTTNAFNEFIWLSSLSGLPDLGVTVDWVTDGGRIYIEDDFIDKDRMDFWDVSSTGQVNLGFNYVWDVGTIQSFWDVAVSNTLYLYNTNLPGNTALLLSTNVGAELTLSPNLGDYINDAGFLTVPSFTTNGNYTYAPSTLQTVWDLDIQGALTAGGQEFVSVINASEGNSNAISRFGGLAVVHTRTNYATAGAYPLLNAHNEHESQWTQYFGNVSMINTFTNPPDGGEGFYLGADFAVIPELNGPWYRNTFDSVLLESRYSFTNNEAVPTDRYILRALKTSGNNFRWFISDNGLVDIYRSATPYLWLSAEETLIDYPAATTLWEEAISGAPVVGSLTWTGGVPAIYFGDSVVDKESIDQWNSLLAGVGGIQGAMENGNTTTVDYIYAGNYTIGSSNAGDVLNLRAGPLSPSMAISDATVDFNSLVIDDATYEGNIIASPYLAGSAVADLVLHTDGANNYWGLDDSAPGGILLAATADFVGTNGTDKFQMTMAMATPVYDIMRGRVFIPDTSAGNYSDSLLYTIYSSEERKGSDALYRAILTLAKTDSLFALGISDTAIQVASTNNISAQDLVWVEGDIPAQDEFRRVLGTGPGLLLLETGLEFGHAICTISRVAEFGRLGAFDEEPAPPELHADGDVLLTPGISIRVNLEYR